MIHPTMRGMAQPTPTLAMISALVLGLSSCDSMIYEDQGDCSVHYRVPFTFTTNILNADAFASQVTSVTLYVFDRHGQLVLSKSDSGASLESGDYGMDIDLLPGTYDMVAWCGGDSPTADPAVFAIGGGAQPSSMSALSATLPLKEAAGDYYVDQDIKPIFYGTVSGVRCEAGAYGHIDLPVINLMKDTNVLKVVLENIDGTEMKADDFLIEILADNSAMDHRNNLMGTTTVSYRPWATRMLAADRNESKADDSQLPSGLMAELTTGRFMTDRRPMLRVTRKDDMTVIINLDLIRYLVMVKGHYQGLYSDQAYLDRMDEHTLAFFIDADKNWYTAGGISINGWRIVPEQDEDL